MGICPQVALMQECLSQLAHSFQHILPMQWRTRPPDPSLGCGGGSPRGMFLDMKTEPAKLHYRPPRPPALPGAMPCNRLALPCLLQTLVCRRTLAGHSDDILSLSGVGVHLPAPEATELASPRSPTAAVIAGIRCETGCGLACDVTVRASKSAAPAGDTGHPKREAISIRHLP